MTLAIPPITPAVAVLATDLGVALQPGTVVTAQVLQSLDANLVRIAIANLTLDVATTKPVLPGESLQLTVAQTAGGLTLTPVTPDAAGARGAAVIVDDIPLAPRAPERAGTGLSTSETGAVAQASQVAVTKQAGLSPLFANLATAMGAGQLPQPVAMAAAQLLGLRLPADKALKGPDIKAALQTSGLTMEAALAASPSQPMPDMKAALIVLRQTLALWLGESSEAAAAAMLPPATTAPKSAENQATRTATTGMAATALAALATDAEQGAASTTTNLLTAQLMAMAGASRGPVRADGERAANPNLPPPFRDAVPSSQPVAAATLAPDAEASVVARQLFADADGALARQTLLQIASLPDRADALRSDPMQPRWNFEIPFVTPQGTAMAQFEIARDGGHEADAAQRVWRARFSLDLEPAGPVHALIAFGGETTSVKMWAERPATAAQLRANVGQLGQSFDRADLKAGDIVVADGAPARAKAPSAGHFLNRAT